VEKEHRLFDERSSYSLIGVWGILNGHSRKRDRGEQSEGRSRQRGLKVARRGRVQISPRGKVPMGSL